MTSEPHGSGRIVIDRVIALALLSVAVAATAGTVLLAIAHLDDRYNASHVQGSWMALARYANEGVLYPPLFDGERYGGTRWMPLPILINAAGARLTGEYLLSGKLVALALMMLLIGLVWVALRRLSVPIPLAAALAGSILATRPGLWAATTVSGGTLPVVLQLGALIVVTSSRSRRSIVVAAILAGLAFTSKTTGAWVALALLTWLGLNRRRRDFVTFSAVVALTAVVILGMVQVLSAGRFSQNLVTLTLAGSTGGPWRAPFTVVQNVSAFAIAVAVLLPFAIVGTLYVRRLADISIYHLALGWALLLLLVTYTDVGADFNHALDVTVLVALAVGWFAGQIDASEEAAPLATVLALAVVWAAGSGTVVTLVPDVRTTLSGSSVEQAARPLEDLVGPADEVLSEDPYVPVSLGRHPVVMDAFMLRRLDEIDPDAVDPLVQRILEGEFAYIATMTPLESDTRMSDENDRVWREFHFGLRVVGAMRAAYELDGFVDGYYVYRPVSGSPTAVDS